ncbi:vacuolar alkaline phosphatase [Scheffersomyces amazonensis]|uniref:vacuolar alkaline phosphatase n=1 Tax=Scheffersomyces amazonensis TaxID=1078765 RepID=UPI00315DBFAB
MSKSTDTQPLLGGDSSSVYNSKVKKCGGIKSYISYFINVIAIGIIGYLLFYNPTPAHASNPQTTVDPQKKKNIIFMVTDGMGPASLSLARSFRQYRDQLPINDILTIDKYLVGSSRTRSSNSLVTDSAAGATAFACGLKSYNGAIGVNPNKQPCGTILEALKLQGYYTGLVVTTRITDATPASFSSHVDYRSQEDLIAEHQLGEYPLGRSVDLILGGGRCHFYPRSIPGGCRADNRNLIDEAQINGGWSYVGNREQFDLLQSGENVTLPLLGLLADTDIPYDIDRDSKVYPSLAEQVKVALTALSKATEDSDKGFFLLIEGSRIDHAGHHNDPAAQVREVLAYDAAFREVIKFIDETETETVAISTSDHETGGLVTARQVTPNYPDYLWYPEILANSQHSGDFLAHKLASFKNKANTQEVDKFIKEEILEKDMGITNYKESEIELIKKQINNPGELLYVLNDIVSFRSQTGWTTRGHSAVDVNIYAYTNSPAIKNKLYNHTAYGGLLGNHENIEIGSFMEAITGSDLSAVTKLVSDTKHSPNAAFLESIQQEGIYGDEYHSHI